MAGSKIFKRLALLGVLIFAVLFCLSYGISVAIGESALGFESALAFFLRALTTVVPVAVVLGALPLLVLGIASSVKKKQQREDAD